MKIKKIDLSRFLKLIMVEGEIQNTEAIIKITDSCLDVFALSPSNIFTVHGKLKGSFDWKDEIGINDLKQLIKFLNNFGDEEVLDITKKANKLNIVSADKKLKIAFVLQSPDYIKNNISTERFATNFKDVGEIPITLTKEITNKIIGYCNSLGADKLNLSVNDKELTLTTDNNENSIVASFELDLPHVPFSISVSRNLLNILWIISDDVLFFTTNESRNIGIVYMDDNIEFTYILAKLKIKE